MQSESKKHYIVVLGITVTNVYQFLPREAAMLARSWGSEFCLSVCLSVRLSVTRLLCDETIEFTAEF